MKNYSTPTTAKAMYNMAKELVRIMTCPLGKWDDAMRVDKIINARMVLVLVTWIKQFLKRVDVRMIK